MDEHHQTSDSSPPPRSWLPHPAYLTLAGILVAMIVGTAWFAWPYYKSSQLASAIEARGGVVRMEPGAPAWMRANIPRDLCPSLPLIHDVDLLSGNADDDLLQRLSRESQLQSLYLRGDRITDAGVDLLHRTASLRTVILIDCPGVTPAARDRLQAANPRAKVSYRGPALLGVEGVDDPLGCKLRDVRTGTPASRAGLLPGDIITRFDRQKITSYDSLIAAIAARKPGEEVDIGYIRDGSPLETRAVVAGWN
jgi:membrane-associated protease RseP (regulator of RpoE activity)